jgi:CBS domain-containing protein
VHVDTILARKGTDVVVVSPGVTLAEAVTTLTRRGIGAVVVSVDGRRIDGILSERDVVRRLAVDGPDALEMTVARAMTRAVRTCRSDDTVDHLMREMTQHRFRHLPVVDDDGMLCGIVSIGDVVKSRLGELEAENQALFDYIAHPR